MEPIRSSNATKSCIMVCGLQHRRDGETGIELAKRGKHIIISKIRDGTPASYSCKKYLLELAS